MYKQILVALDGSPASEQALKQALELAHYTGAALTSLAVVEKLPAYAASLGEVQDAREEIEKFFARVQANAVKSAQSVNVPLQTVIRAGQAAQIILHFAEEGGFDLIVIGASGERGLGGTADRVAENARCSVLIARTDLYHLLVKDVMSKRVATVSPSMDLHGLLAFLLQNNLKAVPVVENNQVLGMITGGDLLVRGGIGLRLSLQRLLPHPLQAEMAGMRSREKAVAEIMTTPAITIRDNEKVVRAAQVMAENQVKRIPVVDENGILVGIISRLDVLSSLASIAPSEESGSMPVPDTARAAGDVMFRDVFTVGPDTSLNDVINQIVSSPQRRVAVIDDDRRVLGIITDADLLHKAKSGALPLSGFQQLLARFAHGPAPLLRVNGQAADVMDRNVFSVFRDTPLKDVVQLMIEKRVKRMIVTDEMNHLVGMIDRDCVLRAFANGDPIREPVGKDVGG
jgi:CBS domain-containing protein/nucleotide-binding universal stress UspA family protein